MPRFWADNTLLSKTTIRNVLLACLVAVGACGGSAATTVPTVDQLEWSIMVEGNQVTLRGDLPDGYPTETWLDDELLDRDDAGDFSWNLEEEIPEPVALIEAMTDCPTIVNEANFWIDSSDDSDSRDLYWRQLAYGQAAIDHGLALGCE